MKFPVTAKMTAGMLNTDTLLVVTDADGKLIGQADPFVKGIPVSKAQRQKLIDRTAARIILDYKKGVEKLHGIA